MSTTAPTPAANAQDQAPQETMEVEVCCAGVSYFVREPVLGAYGETQKNDRGEDVFVTLRKEAVLSDKIELSSFEAKRLMDLGAVQEPGSALLPGDPRRPLQPTPFGIPVPDQDAEPDEDGNRPLTAFKGPVMGDPTAPSEVNPNDPNALAAPRLSAEEAARLEAEAAKAAGQTQENSEDTAALRSAYEEEERDTLAQEAEDLELTVVRSDGREDLPPRKVDYVDALVAHKQAEAGEGDGE